MINYIKGKLSVKKPDFIVVEAYGVGYHIYISLNTFSNLPNEGDEVKIFVQQILKDDGISLYGFISENERDFFNLLIKVSKVGPKLALSILSGFNVEELKECIATKNHIKLASIPGIGKKTAERIVVELKDKLDSVEVEIESGDVQILEDVVSALVNLGYKKQDCLKVVKKLDINNFSFEELLKEALKQLTS
ncbi:Holliday junction branch migration protein RuvA [Deferribacter thermophilus]|uniref:Holliday junction branch migration protein RuvA n=1 Tax=Deferribacter thermophilus TaxID=53573 RepID=UPI003C152644